MSTNPLDPTQDDGLNDLDLNSLAGRMAQQDKSPPEDIPRTLKNAEDRDLVDWVTSFGSENLELRIYRIAPETWRGVPASGKITTLYEIPEDIEGYVQDCYGGGTYSVEVWKRDEESGRTGVPRLKKRAARRFRCKGEPKNVKDMTESEKPLIPVVSDGTSEQALRSMEGITTKLLSDKDNAVSKETMNVVTDTLKLQIATLQAQLVAKDEVIKDKDRQIAELTSRPTGNQFQENLLLRLQEKNDNRAAEFEARLSALRETHASELRQKDQSYQDALKRYEDSEQRRIDMVQRSHEREIKNLEQTFEMTKSQYEFRIKNLERDLAKQDQELTLLRAKKEKSPMESIQEAIAFKNNLDDLMGDGKGDEEPKSTVDKIVEAAAPVLQQVGQRIMQQGQQQQAQGPRRRRLPPPAQPVPTQHAQPMPTTPPEPVNIPPGIDPQHIQLAVDAMAGAVVQGMTPTAFVEQYKPVVASAPGVLDVIRKVGIDAVLDDMAGLKADSPLTTHVGRSFARQVATLMLTT